MQKFLEFLCDEDGATAVEYGIMVAAIAAVIITIVVTIGQNTENAFTAVSDELAKLPGTT